MLLGEPTRGVARRAGLSLRSAGSPLRAGHREDTRVMRYRSLGNSGLVVSVAGLGGNNFGRRLDLDATRAVVDAALDAGITLLDTADSYGGAGRSEEILGEVLAGRRDQVVLATKFGHRNVDMGYGRGRGRQGRARVHHAGRGALAAPAADRLHRPLPVAHPGPGDADRGDPRGPGRPGDPGQGALHRAFQLRRLADRGGGRRGPGTGRHRLRLRAEPLVAAGARRRGRGRARPPGTTAWACCRTSRWPTAC